MSDSSKERGPHTCCWPGRLLWGWGGAWCLLCSEVLCFLSATLSQSIQQSLPLVPLRPSPARHPKPRQRTTSFPLPASFAWSSLLVTACSRAQPGPLTQVLASLGQTPALASLQILTSTTFSEMPSLYLLETYFSLSKTFPL